MRPPPPKPITTFPYKDNISDSRLLTLHPELQPIFAKRPAPQNPPPTRENITRIRKGFSSANARLNTSPLAQTFLGTTDPEDPKKRHWTETDYEIPVRDNTTIPIRIYAPKSKPRSGVPVVVLLHGGGWVMGDVNTEALLARAFTFRLGVLTINVAFRNYPEASFPQPTTDSYDAVKWVATSPVIRELGGSHELGFVLAGVSGGGTYAVTCAHMARDEGLRPHITAQWLTCPVLLNFTIDSRTREQLHWYDTATVNRSWTQCAQAPLMNSAMSDAISTMADYDFASVMWSPLWYDSHAGLGEGGLYVQVCGMDPWRDGGRIYSGLCSEDGARVKLKVYEGLPHCWWTYFPGLKVTAEWLRDSVDGLKWLLTGPDAGGSDNDDDGSRNAKL